MTNEQKDYNELKKDIRQLYMKHTGVEFTTMNTEEAIDEAMVLLTGDELIEFLQDIQLSFHIIIEPFEVKKLSTFSDIIKFIALKLSR